jgi:DNA-binding transcriptional regulator YiaG
MAKKWSDLRAKRFSKEKLAELDRRADKADRDLTLAQLRADLGVTQEALASALEIDQTQVSRFERREDNLVSTVRRAVRALGGELEITAVVGDRRVKLSV